MTGPESSEKSVIGNDLKIIGQGLKIIGRGVLQVDGEIEGDVQAAEVIVGEKGQVTGMVAGRQVVVRGKSLRRHLRPDHRCKPHRTSMATCTHVAADRAGCNVRRTQPTSQPPARRTSTRSWKARAGRRRSSDPARGSSIPGHWCSPTMRPVGWRSYFSALVPAAPRRVLSIRINRDQQIRPVLSLSKHGIAGLIRPSTSSGLRVLAST
jgi:hypothetical protein